MASDEVLAEAQAAVWRALRDAVDGRWTALWGIGPNPAKTGQDTHVCIGKHRWKIILADMGEIKAE